MQTLVKVYEALDGPLFLVLTGVPPLPLCSFIWVAKCCLFSLQKRTDCNFCPSASQVVSKRWTSDLVVLFCFFLFQMGVCQLRSYLRNLFSGGAEATFNDTTLIPAPESRVVYESTAPGQVLFCYSSKAPVTMKQTSFAMVLVFLFVPRWLLFDFFARVLGFW